MALTTGMLVRILGTSDVGTLFQIREATKTCVIKLTNGTLKKNVPLDDVEEAKEEESKSSPIRLIAMEVTNSPSKTVNDRPPSSPSKTKASALSTGDVVEANYKGKGRFYRGKIIRKHVDGTFDIEYDDGDVEKRVEAENVKAVDRDREGGSGDDNRRSTGKGGTAGDDRDSSVRSPSGRSKSKAPPLSTGDVVEANYKGKGRFYRGKIIRKHVDGTFDIEYDDGDVEKRVEAENVKAVDRDREGGSGDDNRRSTGKGGTAGDDRDSSVRSPSGRSKSKAPPLSTGDVVEANYKGKGRFYRGKIIRKHVDGTFDIEYDDGDVEKRVEAENVKAVDRDREGGSGDDNRRSTGKGGTAGDDRDSSVRSPSGRSKSKAPPLSTGDVVEANYKGKGRFYRGKIIRKHVDGTFDIEYDDGDVEKRVEAENVKAVDRDREGGSGDDNRRSTGKGGTAGDDRDSSVRSPSGRSKSKAPPLSTGDVVEANYKGKGRFYRGKIIRKHVDGTFDIEYDDGDVEKRVEAENVKAVDRDREGGSGDDNRRSTGKGGTAGDDRDSSVRSPSGRSKSKAPPLSTGDVVEANYKGKGRFYRGKIIRKHVDGTFDIEYDDGDVEKRVEAENVKAVDRDREGGSGDDNRRSTGKGGTAGDDRDSSVRSPSGRSKSKAPPLSTGDVVEANYKGKGRFYRGKIIRKHVDGTFDIEYDDGDVEKRVEAENVKAVDRDREGGSGDDNRRSTGKGGTAGDDRDSSVRSPSGRSKSKAPPLSTGDVVEANYKGKGRFYRGKIIRKHVDGTFDIEYDDGDVEKRVEAENVKAVDRDREGGSGDDNRRSTGKGGTAGDDRDSSVRSPSGRSKSKAPPLSTGDVVEANYKGKGRFYRGKIIRKHVDGTFDIEYDDGDVEKRVEAENVKAVDRDREGGSGDDNRRSTGKGGTAGDDRDSSVRSPSGRSKSKAPPLSTGDVVEANYKGKGRFYRGKIIRKHVDGTFDIEYDDGDVEKRVEAENVKAVDRDREGGSGDDNRRSTGKGGTAGDDRDSSVRSPSGRSKSKAPPLSTGDVVEANYKGKGRFYRGKIIRKHVDGTFDIEYDDGDVEKRVEAENVKAVDRDREGGSGDDNRRSTGKGGTAGDDRDSSVRSPSGRSKSKAPPLSTGDVVEANYKGKGRFYRGKIIRKHVDGTFDIEYDDGDVEKRVEAENVKAVDRDREGGSGDDNRRSTGKGGTAGDDRDSSVRSPSGRSKSKAPPLSTGDVVEANYKGKGRFYRGKIIRKHVDGTFDIEYDDGDVEKRVEAENVKAVDRDREGGSGDDNRRSTGKGGTAGDDRDSSVRSPSGRSKSKAPPLSTGDVVEANYKGKGRFYRGKIIRKHVDGTFDIEYDDGDVEKRVEAENVKAVDRDREGGSGDDNRRSTGKGGTAGDDRDSSVRSPSGRSKSKAPPLSTGDVVEANYKGKGRFYRGKIIRKHVDGTFDIEYDDGDVEKRVEAENVKAVDRDREGGSGDDNRRSTGKGGTAGDDRDSSVRSPSGRSKSKAPPLSTGDVVEANYKGKGRFYRGKIIRKHVDGTFDIEYDDGDVEKRVEAENVKAVDRDREGGSGDDNRRSTGKGGTAGDDRDSSVRSPSGRSKSKAPPLSTGDVVEANYKGKGRFYRGKIIRKHVDGTFDIEYDDGDVEKRVEAENVKATGHVREDDSDDSHVPRGSPANRVKAKKAEKRVNLVHSDDSCDSDKGQRRSKTTRGNPSLGTRVTLRTKGTPNSRKVGSVSRIHRDGSCDIEYRNGGKARRIGVDDLLICSDVDSSDDEHPDMSTEGISFRRNQFVMACWGRSSKLSKPKLTKTWKEARVLSHNSDGTYTIRYSNGDVEEDAPTKALKRLRSSADSSQNEERGERRVKIPDESMSSTDRLFLLEQLAMTLYEEGKMKRKPRLSSDELSSESSNSSSGDSTDDSRPPNKTSIKPDRKMEQILRKLFDRASLQSFKRAFNEQDVKKAGRINRKKIIDVVGDLCKSELQDSAMGGFSIKRTLTQWFDSQYSLRASSAFDFSTFMLAFAVAKDRMCKQGMEKRLAIALEGRFASHHEHKRQLEMWQQKLGFRTFETLQRYFHDNALPRMFPARVRVREIGHIFNEVTRSAVPNKPVEVYLQQLRLHPHQTLLFTEFLCCYFQLYGSVDPRPPSWAAEQVDLRPVAFVASCLFSNGDPCCQRHGDLVRRLSVGRTPAQADLIIRFREAFEALTDTANGEKDTISSSQLETFGVNVVPDTSVLQPAFAALRKRTGMVSLVEIYATCGFVIDEVTSAPTVANAIEKLRLRNDVVDVRRIIGLIRNMCLKLLRFPNNPDYWRIRADSPAFQQKLGRFDGATNLLEAVGFVEYNKSHYEVRGARMVNGKRVSSLPKASLDLLRETCTELDAELSLLDGVESVASVLKRIGVERQRETPLSLDECEATLRHLSTYIDNVLKNPTDSRCWRIRASNKTFQRQIGYQPFSSDLMASIGYESISTSQGDVFVLRGTGSTVNSAASRPESDVSLSNFSFSRLSEQAEWFLWRRKQEIDSLLQDDMQYLIEVLEPTGSSERRTTSIHVEKGTTGKVYPYGRNVMDVFSKTSTQKLQVEMIQRAFEALDDEKKGYLLASRLELATRNQKQSSWGSFDAFDLDQDGRIDLVDFVGAFGPALDHSFDTSSMLDVIPFHQLVLVERVSTLVGRLRLLASPVEVMTMLDLVISILLRISDEPSRQELWSVAKKSDLALEAEKFSSLRDLLSLVGFSASCEPKSEVAFTLQPDKVQFKTSKLSQPPPPQLSAQAISRLRLVTAILGGHARCLLFPHISDVAAVARALGDKTPTENWMRLLDLVLLCLENILKHPEEDRYRQLNTTTQTFTNVVSKVSGGVELLVALGFRETDRGTLLLPHDVDSSVLKARRLELEMGRHILRVTAKLGSTLEEIDQISSPRSQKVDGQAKEAILYYKQKAIAADLAREEAMKRSMRLEKQLDLVSKKNVRHTASNAAVAVSGSRAKSISVTKSIAKTHDQLSLKQTNTFADTIEEEILSSLSPRKRPTTSAGNGPPSRLGGRGQRNGREQQSRKNPRLTENHKLAQRRPPARPSTTGGMYESTLSMDVDAGSESVVLKPSAFIQKGALLRVGSEQRDLTEERLITGTDESSPAKLTRVLLHTPLHFAHSARELVFLMPLRSAEVMARARSSGIESEFRAFILNELLDQVFSCVSQQIVFRVPKEQRFENCSLGTFQQLHVLPISVGSRVVVGNNGCSMLLGWSNGKMSRASDCPTSQKLVALWEGLEMESDPASRQVKWSDVLRVTRRNHFLASWHATGCSLKLQAGNPSRRVSFEEFAAWSNFEQFRVGCRDNNVSEAPEASLAITLLRKPFRLLLSAASDGPSDVFKRVQVRKAIDQALKELEKMKISPEEMRNLHGVQNKLEQLQRRRKWISTGVTWPETVYFLRHERDLDEPELFRTHSTIDLDAGGTTRNVLEVVMSQSGEFIYALLDDGYVEVSKIDSTSTKLVSRSLVLFDGGTDEKFTDTVDSFVDEHVGATLQFARDKDRRTRQFQRTTRAVSNFIRVSTEERKFLVLCACDSVLVVNSSMMNSDNPAARLDFYLAAPCMMRPIRRWRAEQKVIRNDITLKKSRATVTKKTHQKEPFAGVSSSGIIERFQLSFDCSLVVYETVQSRGIIWIAKADSGTLIGRINEYFSLVEGNTLWAMHSSQHLPGPVICIASPNAGHVSVWQVSLQSSSKLKSLHKQHVCQSEPTTRTAGASGSRTQVSALAVTSEAVFATSSDGKLMAWSLSNCGDLSDKERGHTTLLPSATISLSVSDKESIRSLFEVFPHSTKSYTARLQSTKIPIPEGLEASLQQWDADLPADTVRIVLYLLDDGGVVDVPVDCFRSYMVAVDQDYELSGHWYDRVTRQATQQGCEPLDSSASRGHASSQFEQILLQPERVLRMFLLACAYIRDSAFSRTTVMDLLRDIRQNRVLEKSEDAIAAFSRSHKDTLEVDVRGFYRLGDNAETELALPFDQKHPATNNGFSTVIGAVSQSSSDSSKVLFWNFTSSQFMNMANDLSLGVKDEMLKGLATRSGWNLEARRLHRQIELVTGEERLERIQTIKKETVRELKATLLQCCHSQAVVSEEAANWVLSGVDRLCWLVAAELRSSDPVEAFIRHVFSCTVSSQEHLTSISSEAVPVYLFYAALKDAELSSPIFRPWISRLLKDLRATFPREDPTRCRGESGNTVLWTHVQLRIRQWRSRFFTVEQLCWLMTQLGLVEDIGSETVTIRVQQHFGAFAMERRYLATDKARASDDMYHELFTFIPPRLAVDYVLQSCNIVSRVQRSTDVVVSRVKALTSKSAKAILSEAHYARMLRGQMWEERIRNLKHRQLILIDQSSENRCLRDVPTVTQQQLRLLLKTPLPDVGLRIESVSIKIPQQMNQLGKYGVFQGVGKLRSGANTPTVSLSILLCSKRTENHKTKQFERVMAFYRKLQVKNAREYFLPVCLYGLGLPIVGIDHVVNDDRAPHTLVCESLENWRTTSNCVRWIQVIGFHHEAAYWHSLMARWCRQVLLALLALQNEGLGVQELDLDDVVISPNCMHARLASIVIEDNEDGSNDLRGIFGRFVLRLLMAFEEDCAPTWLDDVHTNNASLRWRFNELFMTWRCQDVRASFSTARDIVEFDNEHMSNSLLCLVKTVLLMQQPQNLQPALASVWSLLYANLETTYVTERAAQHMASVVTHGVRIETHVLNPARRLLDGGVSTAALSSLQGQFLGIIRGLVLVDCASLSSFQLQSALLRAVRSQRILDSIVQASIRIFLRCMAAADRASAHQAIRSVLHTLTELLGILDQDSSPLRLTQDLTLHGLLSNTICALCQICSGLSSGLRGTHTLSMSTAMRCVLWRLSEPTLRDLIGGEGSKVPYPHITAILQRHNLEWTYIIPAFEKKASDKNKRGIKQLSSSETIIWWRENDNTLPRRFDTTCQVLASPAERWLSAVYLGTFMKILDLRFNVSSGIAIPKYRLATLQTCFSPNFVDRKAVFPTVFLHALTALAWIDLEMVQLLSELLRDPNDRIVHGVLSVIEAYTRMLRHDPIRCTSTSPDQSTPVKHQFHSYARTLAIKLCTNQLLLEIKKILPRVVRTLGVLGESGAINTRAAVVRLSASSRARIPISTLSVVLSFFVNALHGGDECTQAWRSSGLISLVLVYARANAIAFVKVTDANLLNEVTSTGNRLMAATSQSKAQWSVFSSPPSNDRRPLDKVSPFRLLFCDIVLHAGEGNIALVQYLRAISPWFCRQGNAVTQSRNLPDTRLSSTHLILSKEYGKLTHVWEIMKDVDECEGTLDEKEQTLRYATTAIRLFLATRHRTENSIPTTLERICATGSSWLCRSWREAMSISADQRHFSLVMSAMQLVYQLLSETRLSFIELRQLSSFEVVEHANTSMYNAVVRLITQSIGQQLDHANEMAIIVRCGFDMLHWILKCPDNDGIYTGTQVHRVKLLQDHISIPSLIGLLKAPSRELMEYKLLLWTSILRLLNQQTTRALIDAEWIDWVIGVHFNQDADLDTPAVRDSTVVARLEALVFLEALWQCSRAVDAPSVAFQLLQDDFIKVLLHYHIIAKEKQRALLYAQTYRAHSRNSRVATIAAQMLATAKRMLQLISCLAIDFTTDRLDSTVCKQLEAVGISTPVVMWHSEASEDRDIIRQKLGDFWKIWPHESIEVPKSVTVSAPRDNVVYPANLSPRKQKEEIATTDSRGKKATRFAVGIKATSSAPRSAQKPDKMTLIVGKRPVDAQKSAVRFTPKRERTQDNNPTRSFDIDEILACLGDYVAHIDMVFRRHSVVKSGEDRLETNRVEFALRDCGIDRESIVKSSSFVAESSLGLSFSDFLVEYARQSGLETEWTRQSNRGVTPSQSLRWVRLSTGRWAALRQIEVEAVGHTLRKIFRRHGKSVTPERVSVKECIECFQALFPLLQRDDLQKRLEHAVQGLRRDIRSQSSHQVSELSIDEIFGIYAEFRMLSERTQLTGAKKLVLPASISTTRMDNDTASTPASAVRVFSPPAATLRNLVLVSPVKPRKIPPSTAGAAFTLSLSPQPSKSQTRPTELTRESLVQTLLSIDLDSARALAPPQQCIRHVDKKARERRKRAGEEDTESLGSGAYSPFSASSSDESTRKKKKEEEKNKKAHRKIRSSRRGTNDEKKHEEKRRDSGASSRSSSASHAESKPIASTRTKSIRREEDATESALASQLHQHRSAMATLRRVFDKYDVDGDGEISFLDLRRALSGHPTHAKLSNMELQRWIAQKDRRGVGAVDLNDFVHAFHLQVKNPSEEIT